MPGEILSTIDSDQITQTHNRARRPVEKLAASDAICAGNDFRAALRSMAKSNVETITRASNCCSSSVGCVGEGLTGATGLGVADEQLHCPASRCLAVSRCSSVARELLSPVFESPVQQQPQPDLHSPVDFPEQHFEVLTTVVLPAQQAGVETSW